MKISIKSNLSNRTIWLTISHSNLQETLLKEQLYQKILMALLNNSSINLITVAPQDYSLAYDIIPYHPRVIKGNPFLVNEIDDCDFELIESIILSEEFRRTLLIVVKKAFTISDNELNEIMELIKNKPGEIAGEVIFCEDDGDSLCLYNCSINLVELEAMAKSITLDVEIV